MKRQAWIAALAVALFASSRGLAAEPQCCEPTQDGLLKRIAPAGGWYPLRRRSAALVETLLLSPVRRPGRLLPQAASPGLPAALPVLLHLGATGNRLSPEQPPLESQ